MIYVACVLGGAAVAVIVCVVVFSAAFTRAFLR